MPYGFPSIRPRWSAVSVLAMCSLAGAVLATLLESGVVSPIGSQHARSLAGVFAIVSIILSGWAWNMGWHLKRLKPNSRQ